MQALQTTCRRCRKAPAYKAVRRAIHVLLTRTLKPRALLNSVSHTYDTSQLSTMTQSYKSTSSDLVVWS